jgi:hypothetical protein
MKPLGIGHAKRVITESPQAHGAEIGVPQGNGLSSTPLAIGLLAGAEEIHIAFKRRFKQLVPVLEIGEHRQRLGGQGVCARAKHVSHLALVDKHRHLRLPHHQDGSGLDFHAGHGEAPGQHTIGVFCPLQYIDKLLLDEIHQAHGMLLVRGNKVFIIAGCTQNRLRWPVPARGMGSPAPAAAPANACNTQLTRC